jgi:hypothetical protein|tara:strand:- start:230 stop:370 length:141 start_codon:yes stop_codon:yes gene_type:complete
MREFTRVQPNPEKKCSLWLSCRRKERGGNGPENRHKKKKEYKKSSG